MVIPRLKTYPVHVKPREILAADGQSYINPDPPASKKNPPRWKAAAATGAYNSVFYISKLTPMVFIDPATKAWIRNGNDERAAQEGYKFSEKRGMFTVDWVTSYCTLYEGDKAGLLMDLDDWQYEYFMQVFGWLFFDTDMNRWVRRFKQASVWIPKKNAKSPTLAATGLYLLCGDGEMGQKCYSVARDGNQAMIAHAHAMEMVRFSPELNAAYGGDCKISMVTGTITHVPSRSRYMVVKENKQSTEGFNGSLLVDEVHVVDEALMKRLARAGISRSEPLHIETSTAGDSGEGYGHDRYQLATRIRKYNGGKEGLYAPRFYVLDFSIDQNTSIEKLNDREFIRTQISKCNPTLGRILRPTEPLEDYDQSCWSITKLREYAMYRLNLWLKSGANWIEIEDWINCGKDYSVQQLAEFPCVAGLDLSKTRDMTSLTLMFAVPHKVLGVLPHIYTWHWMPEKTAERYLHNYDFFTARDNPACCLTLIPGKVIPYEIVAGHLDWCLDNFDLRSLGYDPWNSDELILDLMNNRGWDEESLFKVPQGMAHIAPPTSGVERLILNKAIRHPNNPLMEWQFNHVQVIEDKNANKKCVKPERNDFRKIDGIISLIIAWAMFNNDETIHLGMADSVLLFQSAKDADNEQKKIQYNRQGREWEKTEETDCSLPPD